MIINQDIDSDVDEEDRRKQNEERIVIKSNNKRKDKRKQWKNKNQEEFKSPDVGGPKDRKEIKLDYGNSYGRKG